MSRTQYLTEMQEDDEVPFGSGDVCYDTDPAVQRDYPQQEDDSDPESCAEHGHGPSTSCEKRRAQNEIFRAYAAQKFDDTTKEEVEKALKEEKDEKLSIQEILRKQGTSARISNPRDYQTELYLKARDKNIIAVLDTGTGKTHIATLLLRHVLDQELEDRAKGKGHKIAFFLVNSVNLVFQQMNVLQCGLDQSVNGLCGAMGASLWMKETWNKHRENSMVIVCTGEVLHQCLMHSFLTIRDINLLIFDEAHHSKGNHNYARLMRDFYHAEADPTKRPRVFGMTASPVDAIVDIAQAARELEALLDCKIATVSDQALLANHINRPKEVIQMYARLAYPFETPFYREMRSRYGEISAFKKLFDTSKVLSSELGAWASNTLWSFALSEEEARKVERREEQKFHKHKQGSVAKLDQEIKQLREAAEYVSSHKFRPPTETLDDLSPKVLCLRDLLAGYYERTGEARCIVFVERRHTARLLNTIFAHIGGPNLRSDMLVGSTSTMEDVKVTVRSQFLVGAKFRRGELNCLFSTSVGEEGLDIPECNVVVRFDLYKTMIAYVQSRGRARHKNSRYVQMLEMGNIDHQAMVRNAHSAEQEMRRFCSQLPAESFVGNADIEIPPPLAFDAQLPSFTDPKSGAKLTFTAAITVLNHYVATLPAESMDTLLPSYIVERVGGLFVCEVTLPPECSCSPIMSMRGKAWSRKVLSRCSAAFEMCLQLREKGALDENLLPTPRKMLLEMRNMKSAITSKKKDIYPMRIKPEFWDFGYGTVPEQLYLTMINASAGLERPHQPIGLVTRARFFELPEFPIYLPNGTPSQIISKPLRVALSATAETLKLFTTLTLQVYEDIFAKTFEYDETKMSYWLVPLLPERTPSVTPFAKPEDIIDWEQVHEIVANREFPWTKAMPDDFLVDKYIVDPNDGGRRFYSTRLAPHLKPTDPVPDRVIRHKWMDSILDYSINLWAKSRVINAHKWDRSQPVVEVEWIPFRRNFLAHVEQDEDEVKRNPTTYVCPQPLRISSLSTRFVAMCYVFPAIIHRFESCLIALDAAKRVDLEVGPRLALEALTKDSDNSEEHDEVKINFKSGMGPNYERLEFMGDCFLKMATSLSCFVMNPNENEFEFHVRRMLMLCNKNLLDAARKYELHSYVRSMAFSRRTWYPKGLKLLKGKGSKHNGPQVITHQLGDKTLADVCEAFIGGAFMEHNKQDSWQPEDWDQAVKAVKTMVNSEDHEMGTFAEYYAAYEKDMPQYQLAEATASQRDLAQKVEQKHPYHFKYPRLLRSAFCHPSQPFSFEKIPNYQRLEFLGDALLDQAFVSYLFYKYPDKDPQWLTEHKMPVVSNRFLGAICVKLGFHAFIRQNSAALTTSILEYVTEVQDAEREADGAVTYWTTVSEPPKCLADVVEAYVAAMFVDSAFDYRVVQRFFDLHLRPYMLDMTVYDGFANTHPVTRLTNLLQDGFGCREFRMQCMAQEAVIPGADPHQICMVQIHWKVWFSATSSSNRYARVRAASRALEGLEGLPPFEFRRLYGCDCQEDGSVKDGQPSTDAQVNESLKN